MLNHPVEPRELLVVIDMVRGFIEEGPLSDPAISLIIDENVKLIKDFTERGQTVVALKDTHSVDAKEFAFYPPHCIKGTVESELVDQIKVYENEMILIEKDTTNGFLADGFQRFLKEQEPFDKIVVVGCCTDICILQFALTMKTYLQQSGLDTRLIVVKDAVETFESPSHPRKEFNEFSFKLMHNAGIEIHPHLERE